MRALVDGGYLYIAQPPLYKMKRGQTEVYLKNDQALEEKLLDIALEDTLLKFADGKTLSGAGILELANKTKLYSSYLKSLSQRFPEKITEALLFAGVFNNPPSQQIVDNIFVNLKAGGTAQDKWDVILEDDGTGKISRTSRSVTESYVFDQKVTHSHEIKELIKLIPELKALYSGKATLSRKELTTEVRSPKQFYENLMEFGRKGASIQRFKGLGEMNADQLWETTLNPSNRTLLQVRINQFDEADQVFSTLMGDVVEPRKDFIIENALRVENLDV
jgi:DNA gyrase subunit B